MRKCLYPCCVHNEKNSNICKMHKFPGDHYKCRSWMRASGIQGTPRRLPASVYICSCHFVGKLGPTETHPNPVIYIPPVASLISPFPLKMVVASPTLIRGRRMSPDEHSVQQNLDVSNPDDPEFQLSTVVEAECNVADVTHDTTIVKLEDEGGDFQTPIASRSSQSHLEVQHVQYSQSTPQVEKLSRAPDSFDSAFAFLSSSTPMKVKKEDDGEKYEVKRQMPKARVTTPKKKITPKAVKYRNFGTQFDAPLLSYERSKKWSDSDFKYFTGLSRKAFGVLFKLLQKEGLDLLKYRSDLSTPKQMRESVHSDEGHLFMTLVRLRRGYSLRDMTKMFGLSDTTISDIFNTWIRLMSLKFKSMEDAMFVSAEAQNGNQPDCYEPFDNLRCVIDATDIKIQKPKNMAQQCNTFSTYKSTNVIKFLVATSLYGGLSFISEGFEGNISDRQLFLRSNIMNFLEPGDAVMTDRGFDIEVDLSEIDVELLIPPFLGNRDAFTPREVLLAKAIASSRIHVETFIGRMKFWKLIRNVVPNTLLDVLSDIVKVCANLVNFDEPFIQWESAHKKEKEKKSL